VAENLKEASVLAADRRAGKQASFREPWRMLNARRQRSMLNAQRRLDMFVARHRQSNNSVGTSDSRAMNTGLTTASRRLEKDSADGLLRSRRGTKFAVSPLRTCELPAVVQLFQICLIGRLR
jgi:hypothetical protein